MFEILIITGIVCLGIAILFLLSIVDPVILLIAVICIIALVSWIAVALSLWRIAEMQKNIDSVLEIVKKLENRR